MTMLEKDSSMPGRLDTTLREVKGIQKDFEKLARSVGCCMDWNPAIIDYTMPNTRSAWLFYQAASIVVAEKVKEEAAYLAERRNPNPDHWSDDHEFIEKRVALKCASDIRAIDVQKLLTGEYD